jgi:hypothetical protein
MGQNCNGIFYTQDINHLNIILLTCNDRPRAVNKNEIKKCNFLEIKDHFL